MVLYIVWLDGRRERIGTISALETWPDHVDVLPCDEARWVTYRGRMLRVEVA